MKPSHLASFAQDCWIQTAGDGAEIRSAVTGEVVAQVGAQSLEFAAMALAFGHGSTNEKDVAHA